MTTIGLLKGVDLSEFAALLGVVLLFLVACILIVALAAWVLRITLAPSKIWSLGGVRLAMAALLTLTFGVMALFFLFHINSTPFEKGTAMTILVGILAYWGLAERGRRSLPTNPDSPDSQ